MDEQTFFFFASKYLLYSFMKKLFHFKDNFKAFSLFLFYFARGGYLHLPTHQNNEQNSEYKYFLSEYLLSGRIFLNSNQVFVGTIYRSYTRKWLLLESPTVSMTARALSLCKATDNCWNRNWCAFYSPVCSFMSLPSAFRKAKNFGMAPKVSITIGVKGKKSWGSCTWLPYSYSTRAPVVSVR